MEKNKGYFFTFEGIDGSGKSTQHAFAYKYLESKGIPYVITREPGGTPLGEKIRSLVLMEFETKSIEAELLLFSASRAELVRSFILPNLEKGINVICDRFYDSTIAFQGYGRFNQDPSQFAFLKELTRYATGGLKPDLTFMIDVPVDVALARMTAAGKIATKDNFEKQEKDFHERVRQGFLDIAKNEPERAVVIDASKDKEYVFNELIVPYLNKKLGL